MAVVYPSREWMEELHKKVNADEEYKKVAANWEGTICVLCRLTKNSSRISRIQKF